MHCFILASQQLCVVPQQQTPGS